MKDKTLKFWTTPPNVFLVATAPILPNVILGCISYQEINPTTVEMNRLGPSMSFYPNFISILSISNPDFIQILPRQNQDKIRIK